MTVDLHWRMPAPDDWADRLAALDAGLPGLAAGGDAAAAGTELRRLAACRLDGRQQLRLEAVVRRFLATGVTPDHYRRLRVGLISARTLSFLVKPLAAAGPARGLLVEAVEAPYDQVSRFALSDFNPFEGERPDVVVVAVDPGMFAGGGGVTDAAGAEHRLESARALIQATADAVRDKVRCPVIISTAPEVVDRVASIDRGMAGSDQNFFAELNRFIAAGGAAGDWIVWDLASLAADVGHARWFDPVRYLQAKAPFAIELSPLVADSLCALLAAHAGKAGRVAVLDLDNTLWGGVIGDDGLDGIKLGQNSPSGEAFVAFQRYLLGLRERGVVLAVCSKNTDAIAREPFRSHPEMLLREAHVAVFQANWEDKATNLRLIAETLNLGLESLVFIDDNPAERARVRQELPLVQTPEMSADPAWYVRDIARSGLFEHMRLNAEDLMRADAYGAEAKRAEIRSRVGNYEEYLASLGMVMDIAPFDEVGRSRIAQLINKSNQFNLTTRRYNEEAVRDMTADPALLCWQVSLRDSFGQHGVVGIIIVRAEGADWVIDTWIQSCRVLSRGVEEAIMNSLFEVAAARGAERVHGLFIETARNGLVVDFYDRMGFERCGEGASPEGVAYVRRVADYDPRPVKIDVRRTDGQAST
jgi:FkbH-like protein